MTNKIEVGDIVEYGLDSFGEEVQTWRVTMHMKRVEDTLEEHKPIDFADEITTKILLRERTKEIKHRKKHKLPHARRYKLVWCRPEEATHVSLVSVCGDDAPISEVKKIGVVKWPKKMIEEAKKDAVSDFWLKTLHHHDWRWE